MKQLLAILCCLLSASGFTQDLKKIEQELLTQFRQIDYWTSYKDTSHLPEAYDSLMAVNKRFEKKLSYYTDIYPATLRYPFTQLASAGLTIATSSDGFFRIYSWDTWTGGTMKVVANVFQYKNSKKVLPQPMKEDVTDEDEDFFEPGYWYSSIYIFKAMGKTYYLATQSAVLATLQCYEGVQFFTIAGNELDQSVKLIKTQSGITSSLGFEYNLGMMESRKDDDELIRWNSQQKTITLPVVWEDGKVTRKNIVYKFTGRYFEKQR